MRRRVISSVLKTLQESWKDCQRRALFKVGSMSMKGNVCNMKNDFFGAASLLSAI